MIEIRVKKSHELYYGIVAILESWLNTRNIKFDCCNVKDIYYDNEEYDVVVYKIGSVDITLAKNIVAEFSDIVPVLITNKDLLKLF